MSSVTKARVLWIDSEPLSGGSRSQVEFPLEVGPFFGGSRRPSIGDELSVSVLSAGVVFMAKKLDCHHNDVWRLNLPTPKQGLGPYSRATLCFERTDRSDVFRLTVVPRNSALDRVLRRVTRQRGTIERTLPGGTRELGYF
jgi:hypothetical protein